MCWQRKEIQFFILEVKIHMETSVHISTYRELLSLFIEGGISVWHYGHCISAVIFRRYEVVNITEP